MTETPWIKIHLNDTARVKLTESGLRRYRQVQDDLNTFLASRGSDTRFSLEPRTDAEGWYYDQLWHIMQVFGQDMMMGGDPPFVSEFQVSGSAMPPPGETWTGKKGDKP